MTDSYWGGDRAQRVHPRLVAELLLDSIEFHEEPAAMMEHLRSEGFNPDFIRCKGYVGLSGDEIVCVLPFTSDDLEAVAGLGIRRRLDQQDEEKPTAHATVVRVAAGTRPLDFTALVMLNGEVRRFGPARFDDLANEGVRGIQQRLAGDQGFDTPREAMTRMSKGRAIAAAAVEDLALEERNIGFISPSEYSTLMQDVEFYADVSRVHSYLAEATQAAGGCKGCTSSSCYACSSCSCVINVKSETVVAQGPLT